MVDYRFVRSYPFYDGKPPKPERPAQWDSGSNRVTLEATMEKSGTLYTIRILPESVSPDSLSLQELYGKKVCFAHRSYR